MLGTDLCRFGGKTLILRHLLSRNRLSYLHLSVKYIHLLKKTLTVTCLWTSATSGLKSLTIWLLCFCYIDQNIPLYLRHLVVCDPEMRKIFLRCPPRIWRRQNLTAATGRLAQDLSHNKQCVAKWRRVDIFVPFDAAATRRVLDWPNNGRSCPASI